MIAAHCPVMGLAYAVWVDFDPEAALMAMLTGYFDAAGDNRGKHAVTVGGYVSPVRSWSRFQRDWRKVLDPLGIDAFHMTDFMAGEGEFEAWKDRPVAQTAILMKLARVIQRHVHFSPASTVLLDDWRKANQDYELKECRATPYCLAAFVCIDKAIKWIRREHQHDAIQEFVFEKGDTGQGDLLAFMDWIRESVQPGALDAIYPVLKPKSLAPLQAADFSAWEQRTIVSQRVQGLVPRFRPSLTALLKVNNEWGVLQRPKLIQYCDWLGVPKRSGVRRSQKERAKWRPKPLEPLRRKRPAAGRQ